MRCALATALALLGCGQGEAPPAPPATPAHLAASPWSSPAGTIEPAAPAPPSSPPDEVGRASYYADSLAGNTTASGERYQPTALTAAHRTLPFGTVVDVRRPDTGAMVRVRINDRGPFGGRGRIIDLSRRAAEELDMLRAGVVDIELRIVEPAP